MRHRGVRLKLVAVAAIAAAALPFVAMAQVAAPTQSTVVASAPIDNVGYTLAFDRTSAGEGAVRVEMSFTTAGDEPVLLSLPAWTPGAYEISNFSRWVAGFTAESDGKPLEWDKTDHDTWRIRPEGARSVTVSFDFTADTLDNAMTWIEPDFLLVNGTNVFMFPEGRPLDYDSRVKVQTEADWRIATGMTPGAEPATFTAASYHDLVDMPFFIGAFDIDSARIAERWVRFATYPRGSVAGATRARIWEQISGVIPPQVAVFQDTPFDAYTILQIVEESYGGASGLEHQNSHVNVVLPLVLDHPFMPSLISHEIFHAWNVKRLRPATLWPYQYAVPQPATLLWMSEGVTDYYADLAQVRGGVIDSTEFLRVTAGKIDEIAALPQVALEDASLSTWVHPADGTGYIYYPKGSLAGFMLDILIRDASDNRGSLDLVLRELYQSTYKLGSGFIEADFWRVASRVAGGHDFADFAERYVDGRERYPWDSVLALAGLRIISDTTRTPLRGLGAQRIERRIEPDPNASAKARRILAGILHGRVDDQDRRQRETPQQ